MENKEKKIRNYFVNGEEYSFEGVKLSVIAILTNAGLTPCGNYRLIRDNGNKVLSLDEEVPVHNGEKFIALFDGQTPTS